jgi:aspartate/methionine/tyrosine aminotransferase
VLPPIEYLDFAWRWYTHVRYDLASSGIAGAEPELLGEVRPDDLGSRQRFVDALGRRYGVTDDEVVPAMGTSGGLYVIYATLLERGDRVLCEAPSYEPLWRVAAANGAEIDHFSRRFEHAHHIDVDEVLAALRPKTRAVAITNPHNPTGCVLSDAELRQLAEALAARGVSLVVDEAYLELARPCSTARKLGPNVIACASATKCWGVSWARAGWVFLPPELKLAATRVERYVNGLSPPVSWAYGERAVDSADRLLARAHELQATKREMVDRFVASASDVLSWVPPHASSVFGFVRDRRGEDLLPKIEKGITELGVLVAPGCFFGEPSAFRLGWTTKAPDVNEGLTRLARALGLGEAIEPHR